MVLYTIGREFDSYSQHAGLGRESHVKPALHRINMFEFIKKKVNGMVDKKISPKKKIPAKKEELPVEGVVAQRVVAQDYPKNLCIGKDNKTFLTIEEDGSMVFNKNDFPEWKVDNFAREFVNIVEEISKKL